MRTINRIPPELPGVALSVSHRLDVSGIVLGACVLLMTGCQTPQSQTRPEVAEDILVPAPNELKEKLGDFVQFFETKIEAAAADVERRSPAKEHRKAAVLWRIRMLAQCRATVDQDDPRESLVDLWTLCDRMHAYLTNGDGKAIFGRFQPVAVNASNKINEALDTLVEEFVSKDALPKMREKVAAYSNKHPIRGEFDVSPAERLSDNPEVEKNIGQVVTLPLLPLRALGAVGRTPESIHDVSKSVYRFADVLEDLPPSARWQLQLLAMNLEESATVSTTVDSFKKLSESSSQVAENSTRFVQTMDEMPQKLGKEAAVLLESVDDSQPNFQATLKEARQTATAIQGASQDFRETVAGVDRTVTNVRESAAALEQAANAVTVTAREILKFVPSRMKDETGHINGKPGEDHEERLVPKSNASTVRMDPPVALASMTLGDSMVVQGPAAETSVAAMDTRFSFQAVTESAQTLGVTTDKLRQLLGDLSVFVEKGSLSTETSAIDGQLRGTIDFSALQLRGVVDHAAKRLAQLLLLGFILMMVYRFGAARFTRSSKSR